MTALAHPDDATPPDADGVPHTRVVILGTGFAGLGMAVSLKRRGIDDFVVFERESDLGGTWRDNTYPGCQCDVPSNLYSFSFAPNPGWSRTYPPQEEIWDYLRDCARRFGLTPHLRFDHEVLDARWDEAGQRWHLESSAGPWTADVFVVANGGLSEPAVPDIPGLDRFQGAAFHSARWRHDVDLTGKRVAVVGTGASAVQIVPRVQPEVERLHVFQRTPGWVLPHPDRPTRRWERILFRRLPAVQRLLRALSYWLRELLVFGLAKQPRLMRPVERLGRAHLRRQVPDSDLRARLTPDFAPGCKRLLLSDDFYPALTAPNAELVTEKIREITASSIVTTDGVEREVDALVLATGFRVADHPVMQVVRGRDGRSLAEVWEDGGARAYLGTTVSGFPNLFLMTGPNTGIGHTSLVVMAESQMAYVLDALATMESERISSVDVRPAVLARFNDELQSRMAGSVWTAGGCASWYLDDHGRNTTIWPDFTWRFRLRTRRFDREHYELRRRGAPPTPSARSGARETAAIPSTTAAAPTTSTEHV